MLRASDCHSGNLQRSRSSRSGTKPAYHTNHMLPLICCMSSIPWQISKCGGDSVNIVKVWQLHQTYLIVSLKTELCCNSNDKNKPIILVEVASCFARKLILCLVLRSRYIPDRWYVWCAFVQFLR